MTIVLLTDNEFSMMFLKFFGGILKNELVTSKEMSLLFCGKVMSFFFSINRYKFLLENFDLHLQYSTISSTKNRKMLTVGSEKSETTGLIR